jgi:hypothetical protein
MNSVLNWRFPETSVIYTISNGLLFNISWFAIVSTHSAVLAPLLVCLHLVVHFLLMGRGLPELKFIGAVTLFGLLLDQALFYFGVFTINGQFSLAPVWMSCLWPVLATTSMHAFSGLANRPWLAMLLGGLGGAGSYIAGAALSNVEFGSAVLGPWIMAALWMLLFPGLVSLAKWCSTALEEKDVAS